MSDISSEVAFKITQQGAESVAASLDQVAAATGRTRKETGGLNNFIREQRTEQRQSNFLFREAKDAIGSVTFGFMALSSSMGNASETNQKLNKTLVTGYSAFQAADFAMAGLGLASGGTALAIAGVVGGGAALLSFLDNSAEKARLATIATKAWTASLAEMNTQQLGEELKQQETVLAGRVRENAAMKQRGTARAGGFGAISQWLFGMDEKEAQAKVDAVYGKLGERDKEQTKRNKEFAKSILSDLDQRLALEGMITNTIGRRLQMQLEDSMGAPEFVTGDVGGFTKRKPDAAGTGVRSKRKALADLLRKDDLRLADEAKSLAMETKKVNMEELAFLSLLDQGVGTLRSAVDFLGVKTDSFVGKLLQGLDIALSIAKTIKAFENQDENSSSGGSDWTSYIGTAVTIAAMLKVQPGPSGPPGGGPPGGGTIVINAVDAKSFSQMLSTPDNRRVFVQAIGDAARKGK